MEDDEILAALEQERLRLCAFLDRLDPTDWSVPSLCAGWTVADVVAHLTIPTHTTWSQVITGAIRARGRFHRMTLRQARDRAAAFPSADLVQQLRDTAGSPRRMPGSGPMDPLVDVLVHGQDIARPLRRPLAAPAPIAAAALAYVADNSFFGGPKHLAGLHVVATDAEWRSGTGPREVRGTAEALLLAATGRPAAVADLRGEGVDLLAARLAGTAGAPRAEGPGGSR